MKLQKVLSFGNMSDNFRGARMTAHLTGSQRISLLEDIRQEMAKVGHYEYPQRRRRILSIVDQKTGRVKVVYRAKSEIPKK